MIANLISKITGWASLTSQEITDALNTPVARTPNHSLITYAGVGDALGSQLIAASLRSGVIKILQSGTLTDEQQAMLDYAHSRLENGGIDFAANQALIDELGDVLTALAVNKEQLKQIGIPRISDAQLALGRAVTVQEVNNELPQLKLVYKKKQLIAQATDRLSNYTIAVQSWDGNANTEPTL